MGSPHKVHDLGETGVPIEIFQDYLLDLREKFKCVHSLHVYTIRF